LVLGGCALPWSAAGLWVARGRSLGGGGALEERPEPSRGRGGQPTGAYPVGFNPRLPTAELQVGPPPPSIDISLVAGPSPSYLSWWPVWRALRAGRPQLRQPAAGPASASSERVATGSAPGNNRPLSPAAGALVGRQAAGGGNRDRSGQLTLLLKRAWARDDCICDLDGIRS
jgi:hypothetical protein